MFSLISFLKNFSRMKPGDGKS